MKLAIQFFGHLRTFEECAQSVKEFLLDQYDCDVFIHTWSETEHGTQTWHNDRCEVKQVDDIVVNKVKQFYNPKIVEVEYQDVSLIDETLIPCQFNNGTTSISSRGIRFMLYSKNRVNQLRKRYQKETAVEYDYVVMIRPDIKLYKKFVLNEAVKEFEFLNLREGRYSAFNIGGYDFPVIGSNATDILYFAKPNTIDKIIEVFLNLDFVQLRTKGFWNPETFFIVELQKKNIESYFIDYKYGEAWEIIRPKQEREKFAFKDFLKIRINRRNFSVILLGFLDSVIFDVEVLLTEKFKILFRIGNTDKKV